MNLVRHWLITMFFAVALTGCVQTAPPAQDMGTKKGPSVDAASIPKPIANPPQEVAGESSDVVSQDESSNSGEAKDSVAMPEEVAAAPEVPFDPTPMEGPGVEADFGKKAPMEGPDAPDQVVPFPEGSDPFAALEGPQKANLPDSDPRSDTLRLAPDVPLRAGEVVDPFPVLEELPAPPKVTIPPLKVIRHKPDKDVGLVGAVTATFNQPMIPLAGIQDLDALDAPLQVSPMPKGRFVWFGTDTVAFEPANRLPYATAYTATVPAGAKSANGAILDKEMSWTFETPRPKIVSISPFDGQLGVVLDPKITVQFNASVSIAKVLQDLSLRTLDGKKVAIKAVEIEEPLSARTTDGLRKRELEIQESRTVVLMPLEKLIPGTDYRIVLDDEFQCDEGPLAAGEKAQFSFRTYDPLVINEISCGYGYDMCYPGAPIRIEFNNALVPKKFDSLIAVSPKVKGMRIRTYGSNVVLSGDFKPASTYKVTVGKGFVDVHGQTNEEGRKKSVVYRNATPSLALARTDLGVIERRQGHDIPIAHLNITRARVRMATITPKNLNDAANSMRQYSYEGEEDPMGGFKIVLDKELDLGNADNEFKQTAIDLTPALNEHGTGWVLLEVTTRISTGWFQWQTIRQMALVQVTDLGITAALAEEEVGALVTNLGDGQPTPGARVRFVDRDMELGSAGTVDDNGMVRLPRKGETAAGSTDLPYYLVVESADGTDSAFLLIQSSGDGGYVSSYAYSTSAMPKEAALWSITTERGLYRPAEEVYVEVIHRMRTRGPEGDVKRANLAPVSCSYRVGDPRGQELGAGSFELNPFGAGSFKVTPKKNAPLGYYSISVSCQGQSGNGSFQVQEYRTPEYKATAKWLHDGSNLLVTRKINAQVTGKYYFGAPMAGAEVQWQVYRDQAYFTPPGNGNFRFADVNQEQLASPWSRWNNPTQGGRRMVSSGTSILDATGNLTLPVTLDPGHIKGAPVTFTLESSIIDKNRQSVSARSSIIAHWAERYVGIRLARQVVTEGDSVEVAGVVTALDGSRYSEAPVKIELRQAIWASEEVLAPNGNVSYQYKYHEKTADSCDLTAGEAPGRCTLKPKKGGTYLVRALTHDKAGRPVRSAAWLYVYGKSGSQWTQGERNVIDLILDKTEYEPGDTARILVQSPFKEGRGFVLVSREGIVQWTPFVVENSVGLIELPIQEAWMPNIQVAVALVRPRTAQPGEESDDPNRPKYAYGAQTLSISREDRRIQLDIVPDRKAVSPGESITISLKTTDSKGNPLVANVALMVVDEGVLSLIGHQTPKPLLAMYPGKASETAINAMRPMVVPRTRPKLDLEELNARDMDEMVQSKSLAGAMADPMEESKDSSGMFELTKEEAPARGMKMKRSKGGMGGLPGDKVAQPKFSLRTIFKSTAYFNGTLKTGEDGTLNVTVKMPDNLTEFRVMAIAADSAQKFGSAETQVKTRRPLVVRPSLPRFLNLGDRFQASAVVTNQTGFDTDVFVRLLAANGEVEGDNVTTVHVKDGKSEEVRFWAKTDAPGPATFQFAAVALTRNRDTDAAQTIIPTLIPATAEAFATYGVVEEPVKQPLKTPDFALPGFGGLEVTMSSTALTGLQDAVTYLFDYPYECTEQVCSRILPILALKDVIQDFKLGKADTPEEAKKLVQGGIKKLLAHQRSDGGFGSWVGSKYSWLYLSAYATMTLNLAQKEGYGVDRRALQRAKQFLEERLDHPYEWEQYAYGAQTMAALVLARMGTPLHRHIARLYSLATQPERDGQDSANPLSLYARAWLLEAMHYASEPSESGKTNGKYKKEIKNLTRQIHNAAIEKASSVHFAEGARESLKLMMHSEDRTDAIILWTFLTVDPSDPIIEKVVRGIIKSRVHGRWSTTQANAYALLALSKYYRKFETVVPDFTGVVWRGNTALAAHRFKGRNMDIASSKVPMKALFEQAAGDLVLARIGKGRLYYRLGLRYAPKDLVLDAEDRGFAVERIYLPEAGKKNVVKDKDGTWLVEAGSYVQVKLRVVVPDRRYYVAVVDPMPAGFEAVNETFQTTARERLGDAKKDNYLTHGSYWGYWYWNPWDFEERRDDRVQLFADTMWGGVYEYTYNVRATALGEFVVPPTRAEEMYEPETFGRSASERVKILEKLP